MLEGSDEAIDLIRAALCIAGEHNPKLDPEESYRRLEKLGDRARAQIDTAQSLDDIANKLCRLLYRQVGSDFGNGLGGELIAGPFEMADRGHARLGLFEQIASGVVHRVVDVDRVLPELGRGTDL